MSELKGRVGIVTGGSSGIGLTICNALAAAGAKVYSFSRTGEAKPNQNQDPRVINVKVDVTDFSKAKEQIDLIGEKEGIDFLINNAGMTLRKRAEAFTDEDYDNVMNLNVKSVFKLSCMCYPYLKKSEYIGRIINIASMASYRALTEMALYCISKTAVLGVTRALAVEWANENITVNAISPGWFVSELTKSIMDEERKAKMLKCMAFHRFGDTKDIGSMALFLTGDGSTYITGQDFAVDGGALCYWY